MVPTDLAPFLDGYPAWFALANLAFWPVVVAYAWLGDHWDRWRRRRKHQDREAILTRQEGERT